MPDELLTGFRDAYLSGLLAGDRHMTSAVIDRALAEAVPIEGFLLDVVTAAMHEVGERWASGVITIAEEHLASAIVAVDLSRVVKHLSRSDVLRGSVVVTPVEGELHTLGARLLMDALEADRWQVKFLGASTPVDEVVEFARIRQPDIVALSCSCPESIEPLRRTIVGLRALEPTPLVAVGGWLFTGADGPHLGEQADLWSTDAFEAASQLASRPMRGMH